jgi:two-component system, OmpR family, response regulator
MIRVLIFEDDPNLLEMLVLVLGCKGFSVKGLCGGSRALLEAREFCPDVILLDLMMPTGLAVARQLRQAPELSSTPLLGMSPTRYGKRIAAELGLVEHLPKPFGLNDLVSALGRALEGRRPARLAESA